MLFGNSSGEFQVERGVGFESELGRLFDSYAPSRDSSWREYGSEFENETFSVFTYHWGDCECGWESKRSERSANWSKLNPHTNECYQSELKLKKLENGWTEGKYFLDSPKGMKYSEYREIEDQIYRELCKKHNLPYPYGCAVHCTCGHDEKWERFAEEVIKEIGEHPESCPVVRPNFHHKKSGYKLKWYKYPLRDSYANKNLSLKEFSSMIDDCVDSVKNTA